MRIEDLNKTQIVLLALLVSFVTSIATGIVTVSLMEQTPPSFPQTVNRVIERTVEKVTPAVTGKPTIITKETTVVVKEEDLITKSIEETSKHIVSVRTRSINSQGLVEHSFLGWGIISSSDGRVITDSSLVLVNGSYSILTNDNVSFDVKLISQDETTGTAILVPERVKDDKVQQGYTFSKAVFADEKKFRLGQTAIAFGGKDRIAVSMGTVSGLVPGKASGNASSTPAGTLSSIEVSVLPPNRISGGPLINSFGEVMGIYVKGEDGLLGEAYMPASLALSTIK